MPTESDLQESRQKIVQHSLQPLRHGNQVRIQKTGITLVALFFVGLFLHELRHLYLYGHLVPLGLHADVSITTSNDVLGVAGIAKI